MDTILMNFENIKTSKPRVLMLKLTNELDLRRGEKNIVLSNLSICYTWKNIKSSHNIKYQLQHGMIDLNYLMNHILYEIFKTFSSIFKKNVMKRLIIIKI